jgi:hypothetical protein
MCRVFQQDAKFFSDHSFYRFRFFSSFCSIHAFPQTENFDTIKLITSLTGAGWFVRNLQERIL